ncbi:acetyltransferase [Pelagibacterales bacterium SAG-MED47]|nr:acetyltransferase [Pelagibacterales bacterium SAG-MED47]
MKKIILIGAGGHARSCIDIITNTKKYKIEYLFEKKESKNLISYKKLVYNKENLSRIKKKIQLAFICFGQIKNRVGRQNVYEELKKIGFNFPVIISKSSYVSKNSKILGGTIIMHKTVINSNVKIGHNNIINTGSIIEHDVSVGNHNHIAPGAIVNGGVTIGNNCFIGSGSVIKQGLNIKDNSFIQAGKIILR